MSDILKRKARKEYKCCYCGESILKGSLYSHIKIYPWSHPDNEGFDSWKSHFDCEKESWIYYEEDVSVYGGMFIDEFGNKKEFLEHMKKLRNTKDSEVQVERS